MILASAIVWGLLVYAATGVVFTAWFLTRGIGRLDPAAASGSVGFRLLLAPGVAALWPVLAGRILVGLKARAPHTPSDHGGGA